MLSAARFCTVPELTKIAETAGLVEQSARSTLLDGPEILPDGAVEQRVVEYAGFVALSLAPRRD